MRWVTQEEEEAAMDAMIEAFDVYDPEREAADAVCDELDRIWNQRN